MPMASRSWMKACGSGSHGRRDRSDPEHQPKNHRVSRGTGNHGVIVGLAFAKAQMKRSGRKGILLPGRFVRIRQMAGN